MNVNNPVDLAPVLAQLQQALTNLNTVSQQITTENAAITQELQTQTGEIDAVLESLTTVNGELDNTATAVNQHTSDKTLEVTQAITASETEMKGHVTQTLNSFSLIKSVQRGTETLEANGDGYIYIGDLDLNKTVFNINTNNGDLQFAGLQDDPALGKRIRMKAKVDIQTTTFSWEVIEYA